MGQNLKTKIVTKLKKKKVGQNSKYSNYDINQIVWKLKKGNADKANKKKMWQNFFKKLTFHIS